ncbi:D-alanyl-D-alanine carboxypeptidase (penicillin-binding protein 5/6) [Scopulibacillus daqui]|uniref:serine-type D-Ala-D-Ala carboxypeptidase n=1 Tax=Scopulibacillus daqui TaxID=1469162 RepID=A0ABS2Q335_9BACL|nr:D-alanyl-D-alanine carboxypeptidase family protein [Scopulibacillus daqui]MBM7646230.1 D-alanyl-D-alanine carboxypeptidase (penicillin-binding protein 5/6) [Scopulibacillus daqui]
MKAFAAVLTSFMIFFSSLAIPAVTWAKPDPQNKQLVDQVKSAILIEKDTGRVLFSKNANKELPPASMTKIMTLLLIFKALDRHDISLTDKVRISDHAASMGGSQVFLEPGEEMTVNELLKAIAIGSANDASMAMAEYVAGSESEFVKKMNQEVKALGLKHTHFENPTGLPAKDHYSTAHDMAIMAKALLHYEKVLHYTSKYEDYLRENTDNKFWLVNTNKMVKTYPGVDGLKTGYTNEAKYCLTATAKRNDMRVIAVVMGAPTTKERNKQVARLFDYAFANYQTKKLVDANHVVKEVEINKSQEGKVPVVTQDRVVLLLKKGTDKNKIKTKIKINKNLHAPMKKGTTVGYYMVTSKGKVLTKTPLIVAKDIKEASWWQLFKRNIGKMTNWG